MGKGGVWMEVGSQCRLVQRLHSPFSCKNLVWQRDQNLGGVAEAGWTVSGPESRPSALNQLLQASGYSAAPPGSGPKKKSVNRVRQGHSRGSDSKG